MRSEQRLEEEEKFSQADIWAQKIPNRGNDLEQRHKVQEMAKEARLATEGRIGQKTGEVGLVEIV